MRCTEKNSIEQGQLIHLKAQTRLPGASINEIGVWQAMPEGVMERGSI